MKSNTTSWSSTEKQRRFTTGCYLHNNNANALYKISNDNVKHHDTLDIEDIEMIVSMTAIMMKYIRIDLDNYNVC